MDENERLKVSIQRLIDSSYIPNWQYDVPLFSETHNQPKLLSIVRYLISKIKSVVCGKPKHMAKIEQMQKRFTDTVIHNHALFKRKHEELLQRMQSDVDEINKKKPILKDCLVVHIVQTLRKLGKTCSISDYPMEHIDFRDFYISKEYDRLYDEAKNLKFQTVEFYNVYFLNPIWAGIRYSQMKDVEKKCFNLQKKANLILAKMKAELDKLACQEESLQTIASILKDLATTWSEPLNHFLDETCEMYTDYDQLPSIRKKIIHEYGTILKIIAETQIVKDKDKDQSERLRQIKEEFNNKYHEFKDNMAKAA